MCVTIYHNPNCSKSRATLALLKERGIAPKICEYLKTPPSTEQIADLLKMLSLAPRDLIRRKETAYAEAGLDDQTLTESQLITAIHDNPILLERPIVVSRKGAVIGRPPENILSIL